MNNVPYEMVAESDVGLAVAVGGTVVGSAVGGTSGDFVGFIDGPSVGLPVADDGSFVGSSVGFVVG